jgi:amino acid transporter
MSLEAMGPLVSASAVAPLIIGLAGPSGPFVVLLGGVAMGIVALSVARFARALPTAASIYAYISSGLGETAGFLSAWLSYMYYFLFEPLLLLAVGLFASTAADSVFGISLPWYWCVTAASAATCLLSLIGIRLSMRVDLTLAVLANSILLATAIAVVATVASAGGLTLEPLSPNHAPGSFGGLSLALAFGILMFLGFEQSFTLTEEVRDTRHVAHAIYLALALVGALVLFATFTLVVGFGVHDLDHLTRAFARDGTPWRELLRLRLNTGWAKALALGVTISAVGNLIASHSAVVRIIYGMGRARALPAPLGRTLRRYQTPHVAILLQTGLSLPIALVSGAVWGPVTSFGFLGFVIGLAAAATFILMLGAALRFFGRTEPLASRFRNLTLPAIGILILLPAIYTAFYPAPGYPLNWGPWLLLAWTSLGVLYLVLHRARQRAAKAGAVPQRPVPANRSR